MRKQRGVSSKPRKAPRRRRATAEPDERFGRFCIGCGCSDDDACEGGCTWLRVDYERGLGVCSNCPEEIAHFDSLGEDAEVTGFDSEPESLLLPGDAEYSQTLSYLGDRRVPR